ncbi:MAG: PQQ-binding-like beta-propeller repeat protein [Planctomycetaceae bacterium]|nr:PQQ-binding-like beta-propeller repeat protein [Planctomycetaceae bacterium]
MIARCIHLCCVVVCGLSMSLAVANDWPQWMGPQLNGISTESGWSKDWPTPPETAWAKQLGIGFSSVSVQDGRLYTMGHKDGDETVWCLQADSGDVIWSYRYEAALNDNLYEGGPGATPTVFAGRVYTLSVDGQLHCFDHATGDLHWRRDLKSDFGVGLHEWGFNSSPFIWQGRLYVQGGRIGCYALDDGSLIWSSPPHAAGYGAIRTMQVGERTYLVSLDCDGLRISNPDDGSTVAFAAWKSPFATNSTTPIIRGNTIFISTGYNVGAAAFTFDGTQLEEIYTTKRMRNHFNNSILFGDHLYGFDGNSNLGRVVTLTCLNFQTGEVMWKHRGLGCGSLMIADGHLLVLSEKGDLVVAAATADGFEERSRATILSGRCWTVPVLSGGHVFARNASGNLVCVRLPRG